MSPRMRFGNGRKNMKLKKDLVCSQVAGQTVLVDLSKDDSDDTMVSTNDTGAFILKLLEKNMEESDIVKALIDEYEIDEATAKEHTRLFVDGLRTLHFLDE